MLKGEGGLLLFGKSHMQLKLGVSPYIVHMSLVLMHLTPPLPHSQVQRGRRVHLNIPHSCWSKMAEVFQAFAAEVPPSGEESSGSASEDN